MSNHIALIAIIDLVWFASRLVFGYVYDLPSDFCFFEAGWWYLNSVWLDFWYLL